MNICLRCGGKLPEGCALTRKYCTACAAERNRELTRERTRKAHHRSVVALQTKQAAEDRAYCKKCVYYGSEEYGNNLCDYILKVGHRRGCPIGVGCVCRVEKITNRI